MYFIESPGNNHSGSAHRRSHGCVSYFALLCILPYRIICCSCFLGTAIGSNHYFSDWKCCFMSDKYTHLLDNVKRIHFVGIGGSGMCPLDEILHNEGYEITGSDTAESDTLERIRSYGIPVTMGHYPENVNGADLVVYTAAVKLDNPELVSAKTQNIPAIERCIMLGAVVE